MLLSDLKCVSENIDIDKYLSYRNEITSNMSNPEWLGDMDKDKIEFLLSIGSKLWIYFDGEEPVCSMMFIPADQKGINKFGLDFDEDKTADYGPMFVNPKYRGLNLQYQMFEVMEKYAIDMGCEYAIVTAHPDNIYSINNIEKFGFIKKKEMELKRGLRSVYYKIMK